MTRDLCHGFRNFAVVEVMAFVGGSVSLAHLLIFFFFFKEILMRYQAFCNKKCQQDGPVPLI